MAPNVTCRYCGTEPNAGETICDSERDARQCQWMGESDWKRYNDAVDKARAWDAIAAARADEREKCAKIAENCFGGRAHTYASENADHYIIQDETCELIAKKIRAKHTPQENTDV